MKGMIRIILIIVASLVLLGTIFRIVDHNRAIDGKKPMFAINSGKNKDTGAELYYGLGYVAVHCYKEDRGEYTNIETIGSKYVKHVCFSGK